MLVHDEFPHSLVLPVPPVKGHHVGIVEASTDSPSGAVGSIVPNGYRHGISNFHIVPRVRCVCGVGGRFEFNPGVASPPILHAVDIPGNIQVNWLVPVLVGNCHVTSVVRESHTQVLYAIPTPAPFTGDNMQISFTLSLFLSVCE